MPEDRVIRLSSEVALPASVLGETIAIVGMRGSGKTTTAKVIIEQARRLAAPSGPRQAVVIDPTDAWWGLTLGADGEPEGGVEMLVLGGRHSAVVTRRAASTWKTCAASWRRRRRRRRAPTNRRP